jgi:hypothetical protein
MNEFNAVRFAECLIKHFAEVREVRLRLHDGQTLTGTPTKARVDHGYPVVTLRLSDRGALASDDLLVNFALLYDARVALAGGDVRHFVNRSDLLAGAPDAPLPTDEEKD